MTLYRKKMEDALRSNRERIEWLEKHKDFYPLIEELEEIFDREFYPSQNSSFLYSSTYLKDTDDKTLPLLMEEFILSKDWIEEHKPSESNKEYGEIAFTFKTTKSQFGNSERPMLRLTVNYSNMCRRILKGTKLLNNYIYECD